MEREAPDQVDEEHAVGQRRSQVHHLQAPEGVSASWRGGDPSAPFARDKLASPVEHHTGLGAQAAYSPKAPLKSWFRCSI